MPLSLSPRVTISIPGEHTTIIKTKGKEKNKGETYNDRRTNSFGFLRMIGFHLIDSSGYHRFGCPSPSVCLVSINRILFRTFQWFRNKGFSLCSSSLSSVYHVRTSENTCNSFRIVRSDWVWRLCAFVCGLSGFSSFPFHSNSPNDTCRVSLGQTYCVYSLFVFGIPSAECGRHTSPAVAFTYSSPTSHKTLRKTTRRYSRCYQEKKEKKPIDGD